MNIVLLESLGVPEEVLNACAKPLVDAGHTFKAYPKDTDPKVQIERAKDADVIMIANMPLSGEVISACPNLKYIDVAFTGVDHVDLDAARAKGVKVSNAAGSKVSSASKKAIYGPVACSSPRFRAVDTPPLGLWNTRMRGSLAA